MVHIKAKMEALLNEAHAWALSFLTYDDLKRMIAIKLQHVTDYNQRTQMAMGITLLFMMFMDHLNHKKPQVFHRLTQWTKQYPDKTLVDLFSI